MTSRRRAQWLGVPAAVAFVTFGIVPLLAVVRYASWEWTGTSAPVPIGIPLFARNTQ